MNNIFDNAPSPFIPNKLPIDISTIIDIDIIDLLSQASMEMGTYSGLLKNTINPMLLISPLLIQETISSSALEGTHATIEDFYNYEAGNKVDIEKDEMTEIGNYRKALYYAIDSISTVNDTSSNGKLPLTSRIIKEMHKILLSNVRGKNKSPGEFKKEQNYIGSKDTISFTPLPPELTDEYMYNLENYIHQDDKKILIQIAFIHAQFEMIHPFKDGNGRIGRLLIPLFLYYKEYLPYPTFYMSKYFEADRALYLQKLSNISKNNEWKEWIKYFLEGIISQSKINTKKAQYLIYLYNTFKEKVLKNINSKYSVQVLDFIFEQPIFKAKQLKNKLGIGTNTTIYNLLNNFMKLGILKKTNDERNATYICVEILENLD
ncbi:Fic family protein [Peptoanaerobacter stomatis]|uniref:Fic family protein n=1 Tax=Peptoanaerobacter stomatis TaxID=796937 RepID=UPI003FA0FF33